MTDEQLFRVAFAFVFACTFVISGSFRYRARRSGETIPRRREGRSCVLARLLIAAPLYLSFLAYIVNPGWMAWSSLALPTWLRWLAVITGVGTLPLLYWVMASIGKNISETYLTKRDHELVTHGPYHWVRHPLYTVATVVLMSLAGMAANWFMMTITLIAFIGITLFVVPREEVELIRQFGKAYRDVQARTGRFTPRRSLFG